jgi:hypothetical protein
MINEDTIRLLRECNSGIKMGVFSLDEVLDKAGNQKLVKILNDSKNEHSKLGNRTHAILAEYGDEDKEPNAMAKGMSWMKTNVMLTFHDSDKVIADLIIDGCNMGVKSLHRYLNQYPAAEDRVQSIASDLIRIEENLTKELFAYL